MPMKRSIAVAVGLSVVLGLAACSSSGDATRDVEIAQQKQIDRLQERVTSLESRVAWLEVVGRKAIQANPTAYEEQLAADMASLEAQWNTARASADAVAAQVTEQKAAAEKAITDARAAVDAAKAAPRLPRTPHAPTPSRRPSSAWRRPRSRWRS